MIFPSAKSLLRPLRFIERYRYPRSPAISSPMISSLGQADRLRAFPLFLRAYKLAVIPPRAGRVLAAYRWAAAGPSRRAMAAAKTMSCMGPDQSDRQSTAQSHPRIARLLHLRRRNLPPRLLQAVEDALPQRLEPDAPSRKHHRRRWLRSKLRHCARLANEELNTKAQAGRKDDV
jgi:hypothetical protein